MMLRNYNNVLLFKELIEICERILVYRFERNEVFLVQLVKHHTIIKKAMRLKFSRKQMGLFYYPSLYADPEIKKDGKELSQAEKDEINNKRTEAREKFKQEDLDAIDGRLKEMADWYNKNYKAILFENFGIFYAKIEKEILNDEINDASIDFVDVKILEEKLKSRYQIGEFFIQASSGVVYNINFAVGNISKIFESFLWSTISLKTVRMPF